MGIGKVIQPVFTVWTVVQTVLTATFNCYGNRQISAPIKSFDYVREESSYTKFGRNPCTGGFWENRWNITKIIFVYTFFLWSAYSSDPWMDFYASLKRCEITQGSAFWASERCAPKLWGKTPKNWNFGGVNKTFKPEWQKIQILITWKLLSRSWRNFYREYAQRMRLRGWSRGSANKSKMAVAAIFNFGKMSITPHLIKISAPYFMERCATTIPKV